MEKFLITDLVPEGFIESFEAAGYEVVYLAEVDNEFIDHTIADYTGIVISTSLYLNKDRLDRADKLKYILRPGSGIDNVDVGYAKNKGIQIFTSPEANSIAVAEHAIGLLLSLINHIPSAHFSAKNFEWVRKPNTGVEIFGKTLGIIGYGNTGSAFAARMQCFGCEVLVYDKYKKGFGSSFIKESSPDEIQEKADFLSLHIPLTDETYKLISKEYIDKFEKPFYLINTSRGAIVDNKSLLEALESGRIAGAALDVLENEDLRSYSTEEKDLLQAIMSQNVIITPHIAGWTKEARQRIFFQVRDKFLQSTGKMPNI